ncbi:MAG: hypothetical protein Q4G11_05210, partial [Gallicola sp.]|nr:hypothetical protein [Gallicola sp.]
MSNQVLSQRPQKTPFEEAKRISKYLDRATLLAFIISIASTIFHRIIKTMITDLSVSAVIGDVFSFFSAAGAVIIATLVILYSCAHNKAETVRRKGLIDSAYGTKTVSESKGYYDTDGLDFGIEKQLATINENCMYTHRITGFMLKHSSRMIFVMCVVMFICFFI